MWCCRAHFGTAVRTWMWWVWPSGGTCSWWHDRCIPSCRTRRNLLTPRSSRNFYESWGTTPSPSSSRWETQSWTSLIWFAWQLQLLSNQKSHYRNNNMMFVFQFPDNLPCSVALQPGPNDVGKVTHQWALIKTVLLHELVGKENIKFMIRRWRAAEHHLKIWGSQNLDMDTDK